MDTVEQKAGDAKQRLNTRTAELILVTRTAKRGGGLIGAPLR